MTDTKSFKEITDEMLNLYERKNADYGDSFSKSYLEYGPTMCAIRLEDKLNRFKSLTKKNISEVNDESLYDTLVDLANYSILTIIAMGLKPSPKSK